LGGIVRGRSGAHDSPDFRVDINTAHIVIVIRCGDGSKLPLLPIPPGDKPFVGTIVRTRLVPIAFDEEPYRVTVGRKSHILEVDIFTFCVKVPTPRRGISRSEWNRNALARNRGPALAQVIRLEVI